MPVLLAKNWWSLMIRGLAAILLSAITFIRPGITLGALVLVFGAYALIDGLVSIAGAVRAGQAHERWAALMVEGVAGILVAIITVAWPAITALSLVYVVAAWALVTGIAEIAAAVRLRKHVHGEILLALSGVASLVLGLLMIARPLAGALAIALWVGAYAMVFGILLLALGFRLRAWLRPGQAGGRLRPARVAR
jgi:uncharacterized membrane protein HdeD (DUF308 family)